MEDCRRRAHFLERISLKVPDCFKVRDEGREILGSIALSAGITLFLAYFFYRSIWAVIPLTGIGVLYFIRARHKSINRKREELTLQFRDCIMSMTASLQAGYSVENAILESMPDMEILYGKNSAIYQELMLIRRGMRINISLEELLTEFGRRSGCEEIIQFAEIFAIAKRGGGGLTDIMRNTAELIGRKIAIRQEISIQLSGKRMELAIMKGMPFVILIYVGAANTGYFDCLYHNLTGISIMTVCLLVYLVAYGIGEKILSDTMKHLV